MDTSGSSSVQYRDVKPNLPMLTTGALNVPALPGVFPWGPMNQATEVVGEPHFTEIFGALLSGYHSPLQARLFFQGRGRRMVIVRVCHLDGSGNPASAARASHTAQTSAGGATAGSVTASSVGPYVLAHGDTFIAQIDQMASETGTISATAASRTSVGIEPFALVDAQTLTVKVNRQATAQTVTFQTGDFAAIGAATAEEVALVLARDLKDVSISVVGGNTVKITTDRQGTGAYLEITGGSANAVLNFSTVEVQGTGNVANVTSVTVAELKTILEAAFSGVYVGHSGVTVSSDSGKLKITSNTAGTASCVEILAASLADSKVGLDNVEHCGTTGAAVDTLKLEGKYYGTRGNNFTYDIAAASGGEAERFDLTLYENGVIGRMWRNLIMDDDDARFPETIINAQGENQLLRVTDMNAAGTPTQRRPANVTGAALTGGNDGLTDLTDTDFRGTEAARTGLYALDSTEVPDLLIVPDRATATMQAYVDTYCKTHRGGKLIFVPDPPAGSAKAGIAVHASSLSTSTAVTGVPWPRVQVANPDKTVYGSSERVTTLPSALICATMARNSEAYQDEIAHNPSNEIHGELLGAVALEGEDPEDDTTRHEVNWKGTRDYVTKYRVNPIRSGKRADGSWGVWLDDCMSLDKAATYWPSIGEQRVACLVKRVVGAYLETIRTQGHSVEEREQDYYTISAWLAGLTLKGYFSTKKAADAYYVVTDPHGKGINNPLVQYLEQYFVLVGINTKKARRFIDLGVAPDQRALEEWIQTQMAS